MNCFFYLGDMHWSSTCSLRHLYEFSTNVQPFALLAHTGCNLDNGMPEPYQLGYGCSGIKLDECQTQKSPPG